MRQAMACIILFLFAGCVDYQLSGNEKLACANFTNVNVTGIPICEKNTSCQEQFTQEIGSSSFEWVPVGNEWEKTKNHTISTWINLNEIQKKMKQVNGYCKSGNVVLIWSAGIDSAATIQNGLKSAEQANANTLHALTQSIKTAQKWELFRVKDTDAFHAYAELLEIIQGISENDQKNETASIFSQNQEYFEGLSSHIAHNQANGMSVDWKSAFDVYQTGIKYGSGNQAKTILLFSPVWQGLISSFSSQKKAVESLSVLQYINAPQMVEKIAETVRPQNGFVGNALRALKKMEEGMKKLEKEESENHQRIQEELEKTSQLIGEAEIHHQEWEKWETTILAWANATEMPIPTSKNSIQQWKNEWKKYQTEWTAIDEGSEDGSISIGMNVEHQRDILKRLTSLQEKIKNGEKEIQSQNEICLDIFSIVFNGLEEKDEKIDSDSTCEEIMLALENKLPSNEEEKYEKSKVEACVNELNAWNEAVGFTSHESVEAFIQEFGDAAFSACQSAVAHAQNEYGNQYVIQEIVEHAEQLEKWANMMEPVPDLSDSEWKEEGEKLVSEIEDLLSQIDHPVPYENQEEWNESLAEYEKGVQEWMGKGWENNALKAKWKIETNSPIQPNTIFQGVWKKKIENPFKAEIPYSFALEWNNPIEWGEVVTSSGEVHVNEQKVTVLGEYIPAEGLVVSGEGKGVGVTEESKIVEMKLIGDTANVVEQKIFKTEYYPIEIQWTVNEEVSYLKLTQPTTTIEVQYEWKGVITSETKLVETKEELEKNIESYKVEVTNHAPTTLTTNINTGISADPFETEGVWITDESGKNSSFEVSPLFSIWIEDAIIGGGETREYTLVVIRPKGIGAVKALIYTLWSEVQSLVGHSDAQIAAKAAKLSQKIENVLQFDDPEKISAVLPELTKEVELLLAEAQSAEDQEVQVNVEWNEIKETISSHDEWKEDELVKKWIQSGNEAQGKGQTPLLEKITQNMVDWISEQTPKIEENEEEKKDSSFFDQTLTQTIERGKNIGSLIQKYEKNQSLPCGKLMEVGYVCPISEEQQSKIKTTVKEGIKALEKIKGKIEKVTLEEKIEYEKTITEKTNEFQKNENQIQKGMAVLKNTAEKILNELIRKTENEGGEDIVNGVEKAKKAFENEEFGKTIYIAQNLLNYLKGKNPLTGLNTIPAEGIPLIGIAFLGVTWYGYRKWKEKNKPEIIPQSIPRNGENVTRPIAPHDSDE